MNTNMSRRDFLKTGAKTLLATAAITACGNLLGLGGVAYARGKEDILVGEDGSIIGMDALMADKTVPFVYNGKKSILLYNDGNIKAFENICTHKGGPSELHNDALVCKWHGATFDPITGERTKGPAPAGSKLPAIPVIEKEGQIYVAM